MGRFPAAIAAAGLAGLAWAAAACDVTPPPVPAAPGVGPRGGGAPAAAADGPAAPPRPKSALDRFRETSNFRDGALWTRVDVPLSTVTGGRRRIYAEKAALTAALLAHRDSDGPIPAALEYPDGTVFVAETLTGADDVRDTAVMRVRHGRRAEFSLFGADGEPSDTFALADDEAGPVSHRGNVPSACEGCHYGPVTFDPMASFPDEPAARRLHVDERLRNRKIVFRFLESTRRADGTFGVHASLWMSRLAADAASGRLTATDAPHWLRLREKYPDLLPAPK